MKSLQIFFEKFGTPEDVLNLVECEVAEDLKSSEVLVKLLAASINPSDIGIISGVYGNLPSLPAIAGREGVGMIVKVGSDCTFRVGQRVKFPYGTWREFAIANERDLFQTPDDIDIYQSAMAFVNPETAWMILNNIRPLNPGDWVIQNASNSAVGIAFIQIAKSMGVNTINLVRNAKDRQNLLFSYGADLVFEDENFDPKSISDYTHGKLPILGLNSIGGNAVLNIIKCMDKGGEVVTIGGMIGDKIRFPTRELIFNDVRLRGFWLDKFIGSQSHAMTQSLYDKIFDLIRREIIKLPIDSIVKLSDGPKTLLGAYKNRKNGKVLLTP